jgi:hypothetical protein
MAMHITVDLDGNGRVLFVEPEGETRDKLERTCQEIQIASECCFPREDEGQRYSLSFTFTIQVQRTVPRVLRTLS